MPPLSPSSFLSIARDDHFHTNASKVSTRANPDVSFDVQYVSNNEVDGGGRYTGEISTVTLLPHGYGKFMWSNGGEYEGHFRRGCPDGRGEFLRHDGSTYRGDFKNGNMHGLGSLEFRNGDVGVFNWIHGRVYTKSESKRSKSRKMWPRHAPVQNLLLV